MKKESIKPINTNANSAERLAMLVSYLKISYNKLADEIGLEKNTKIYHVKNGRNEISSELAKTITDRYSQVNYDWLLTGKGEMLKSEEPTKEIKVAEILKKIGAEQKDINEIKTELLGTSGELKIKEYPNLLNVRFVSNKARAGWSDNFYSEDYLEKLPIIAVEADANYKGKYLAFEIEGDSMEPDYIEGNIVICREIQRHLWTSKLHYKDYDFVIVHVHNGIMLKEIIDHDVEKGIITCHSINSEHHPDFKIDLREVSYLFNVVEVRQQGRLKRNNRLKDFL